MRQTVKNNLLLGTYLLNKLAMKVSSRWTGRLSSQLWFSPALRPHHPERKKYVANSTVSTIQARSHRLKIRTWNGGTEKKRVLLVHGWGGSWDQFIPLIPHIISLGYQVSAIDLPAHGESSGYSTDLLEWFDVLETCQRELQEEGITYICHSFGFVGVAQAVQFDRIKANRVIAINSPTRLQFMLEQFAEKIGLKQQQHFKYLMTNLKSRVGIEIDPIVNVHIRNLVQKVDVFFIADENDKEVPYTEHEELRAVLKDRFYTTKGLGHTKILKSKELIQIISSILSDSQNTISKETQ